MKLAVWMSARMKIINRKQLKIKQWYGKYTSEQDRMKTVERSNASTQSYSKLLMVNSGNYYLDRLTADVYEGNIAHDVFNYINYINYKAILIFNNVPNHEKMQ